MRHFLIPVLLLGLVAGCSGVKIGPHRIDVQQGNALDQENVARLKPGLNRSQVRFLLGTPLVVDPFRNDRWDYVYVYYKAGKLAEQKRITLFFEGDTLARIEGDLPEPSTEPVAPPVEPKPAPRPAPVAPPAPPATESRAAEPVALVVEPKPEPQPVPLAPAAPMPAPEPRATGPAPEPAAAAPQVQAAPTAVGEPAPAPVAPVPAAAPVDASPAQPATEAATPLAAAEIGVVPPLPSPKNVPAYVDPRPPAELSLTPETDVTQIQPDVIPPFPEPYPAAAASDAPILKSVNEWAASWARRDEVAYLAAYDAAFAPEGGGSRADWEERRRMLLRVARNIELRIDAPVVERAADGSAVVTFNQFYRSDTYRDAVVKQLRLVERDSRWLIADEKVVSAVRGVEP